MSDFIFGNYYKKIGFSKESSYYSMKNFQRKYLFFLWNKFIVKIPNLSNAKEHYQLFLRTKNRKSLKQSEIITYQPNIFEN